MPAIKAAGWPLLMVDGVEADDVIGTLATGCCGRRPGDTDFHRRQGLDPTGQPARALVQHDEQRAARRGRRHGQVRRAANRKIVDYLTLVGDTVDGVPGVQKCGPKTAVKWLEQYGSLEGLVAHADEIGGVVGQNLRDHLGFLPLGKKLVTVACDLANLPAPGERHQRPRYGNFARALRTLRIPHLVARTGSPGRRR
jgi:DNA polymerase-1